MKQKFHNLFEKENLLRGGKWASAALEIVAKTLSGCISFSVTKNICELVVSYTVRYKEQLSVQMTNALQRKPRAFGWY